jgi:hypothetical protein
LIAFENRLLRRIFGPKRREVIGGWREVYNEEPRYFSLSLNIIMMNTSDRKRQAGHVARMGEVGISYILVIKPERRIPLGRQY